jgi:hypothetical protein
MGFDTTRNRIDYIQKHGVRELETQLPDERPLGPIQEFYASRKEVVQSCPSFIRRRS